MKDTALALSESISILKQAPLKALYYAETTRVVKNYYSTYYD